MIRPKGQVHLSCLVLLVAFHFSAASAAQIDAGFSGLWFDPQRNGEGLQLEILDADHALLGWYTYNDEGEQRWFQGVGQIRHATSGGAIEFPQIYVTHGGGFGAASALDNVELQVAGSATLSFSDGFRTEAGDEFEIVASPFRLPLRAIFSCQLKISAPLSSASFTNALVTY